MGVRVGDITKKTNLSRPAVSHHLQIMKDAGIVKVRKEGTKNYYYFDPEMEAFEQLVSTLQLAMKISKIAGSEVVNKEQNWGKFAGNIGTYETAASVRQYKDIAIGPEQLNRASIT